MYIKNTEDNIMKKLAKIFGLLALVLCLGATIAACGSSGDKYTFSKSTIEVSGDSAMVTAMSQTMKAMESAMNSTYEGSTIEVNDKKLIWIVSEQKSELSIEKDGDKDILAGDMIKKLADSLIQAYSSIATDVQMTYYGIKTENGYNIVIYENITVFGQKAITTMTFEYKA